MTEAEENRIFKQSIVPVIDRIKSKNLSMEMTFTGTIAELRKKQVPLDNRIINMMLDKMALDIIPKTRWDYISGKVMDANLVKTFFDWTHPEASDTPLETEIKRRAELMYNASTTEKTVASVATAGMDVFQTAPIALLTPSSVVYGMLTQGGYDILNNKVLLPESKEERKSTAKDTLQYYVKINEQINSNIIPGWMYAKIGTRDLKNASDKKLKQGKEWATKNADWWKSEYDKLEREHKTSVLVNGKTYTTAECHTKYCQYDQFRGECQKELTARYLAEEKAKEQERKAELAAKAEESQSNNSDESQSEKQSENTDYWGQLLKTLGFNGLGNVGKHLGLTLATLPDMIFGVFTGKTKSVGMNNDTFIPLASLAVGHFVKNPMLKAALMGYGGLNLLNKVGNEAITRQTSSKTTKTDSANIKYKQYADEALNPRIANLHIEGNQLLADIDRTPCTITLPTATVEAYKSGALPLNTLANAVLAKSDLMAQQSEQASLAYSNMQQQEKTIGIR